jgi:hypothetical protein
MLASLIWTVLFVGGAFYLTSRIRYWITDYRFSREGIEAVMSGGRTK